MRVLLIAYRFPPQAGVGGHRPVKLVKAWHRQGVPVAVLAGPKPRVVVDTTGVRDLPEAVPRVYAPDPSPAISIGRARRRLGEGPFARLLGRGLVYLRSLAVFFSVPDIHAYWYCSALRRGLELAREFHPTVILVTGPPWTPFLVGASLSRRLGVPLVLDYRDPWTETYLPERPTSLSEWRNPSLERRVLRQTSAVVAAHREILRRLRPMMSNSARESLRSLWVPNGSDAQDFDEPAPPAWDDRRFVLTYAGSIIERRTPLTLLEVLDELLSSGAIDPERFRLRMLGHLGSIEKKLARHRALRKVTRIEGYVSHQESVRCFRASTVNLVIEGVMGHRNVTTPAKVYEVLRAERPLLLLCPEGVTTRLARRAGGCRVAHPTDPEGIRRALLDLYEAWCRGELDRVPDWSRVRFYDRDLQAERYLGFLRRCLEGQDGEEADSASAAAGAAEAR